MQGTVGRLLNLAARLGYTHLIYLPAWRDMRDVCKQLRLDPPELRGQIGAAAGIVVTDWAWETPQQLPPSIHVSPSFADVQTLLGVRPCSPVDKPAACLCSPSQHARCG